MSLAALLMLLCSAAASAAESGAAPSPVPSSTKTPAASASAAPKKSPGRLPKLLREVEKKYADAGSLQADFVQVNDVVATGQKKTSSGTIKAKQPDKVRWETEKPDKNLLVTDGKTFWFYTPPFEEGERGQLIEKKASQVQSQLASALLSGKFTSSKMRITTLAPSRFEVKPNKGTAGTVVRAEVYVNPELRVIEKVMLEHKGGNRSEITLSKIQLGEKLGEDLFKFEAPPNSDRE
jgi:outer membrane lipoprotein carrier protein